MLVLKKRIQNERRMIDKGLDLNGHVTLKLAKLEEQKAVWEANIEKEKKKNGEEKAAEHLNAQQPFLGSFDCSSIGLDGIDLDESLETTFDDDVPQTSAFDEDTAEDSPCDDESSNVDAGNTVKDQGTTAFFHFMKVIMCLTYHSFKLR